MRLADGRLLYGQLREPLRQMPLVTPAIPKINDVHVCLEDPRLQRGFARALRVLERDVPVFLQGETGTGKEAFSAALHRASSRASQPFVAINCAAIPETLIESELFGYRGGSFTGARKDGMVGKLEQAHGGILFLDEIADMPLALQTRLLRVLEERQVVPLGGATARPLDVRLISASHQNLQTCVAEGRFREDLFYRIAGFAVQLPPLRERSDKGRLLDLLLREETKGARIRLDAGVRERLLTHPWPGNVRQLRTCLRTLVALALEGRVTLDDLAELLPAAPATVALAENPLGVSERQTLLTLIEAEHWHIARVAARLGISRNTLYRKLRQHGISRPG
jgi:transcriptional regulator of acetoin/glycerol metabolism